jgi:hypothetical protein
MQKKPLLMRKMTNDTFSEILFSTVTLISFLLYFGELGRKINHSFTHALWFSKMNESAEHYLPRTLSMLKSGPKKTAGLIEEADLGTL